jgi:hypothetical protein
VLLSRQYDKAIQHGQFFIIKKIAARRSFGFGGLLIAGGRVQLSRGGAR